MPPTAADLGLKTVIKFAEIPGVRLTGVRYSPRNNPGAATRFRLADANFPTAPLHRERWAARPRDSLWWNVVVMNLRFKKSTRVWARRRYEHAFRQALAERGYDRLGRRMELKSTTGEAGMDGGASTIRNSPTAPARGKGGSVPSPPPHKTLTGRLDLTPFRDSITASFDEIKRELGTTLVWVERMVERKEREGLAPLVRRPAAPKALRRTTSFRIE